MFDPFFFAIYSSRGESFGRQVSILSKVEFPHSRRFMFLVISIDLIKIGFFFQIEVNNYLLQGLRFAGTDDILGCFVPARSWVCFC